MASRTCGKCGFSGASDKPCLNCHQLITCAGCGDNVEKQDCYPKNNTEWLSDSDVQLRCGRCFDKQTREEFLPEIHDDITRVNSTTAPATAKENTLTAPAPAKENTSVGGGETKTDTAW